MCLIIFESTPNQQFSIGPFLTSFTPRGKFCPLGVQLSPGVKFWVRPSVLLNNRECSPLGVNKGMNITPGVNYGVNIPPGGELRGEHSPWCELRGEHSPWGVLRGEHFPWGNFHPLGDNYFVKNGPQARPPSLLTPSAEPLSTEFLIHFSDNEMCRH
jgi:hypothetical protein